MINSQVDFNEKAHAAVFKKYEKIHPEIFNVSEQSRLKEALVKATETVSTNSDKHQVLDVGCGSGNLTRHLTELGCAVTAADISEHFLQLVKETVPTVETHKLNGRDLSEISDNSYDMVVTYSVLHHIPDYLQMVAEMCRVLKPGGVLYIDHEKNEQYWSNNPALLDFYEKQKPYLLPHKLKRLFNPMWYVHRVRRLKNPRYQAEGDIHVWPDDHIEWDKVYEVAAMYDVKSNEIHDFLLFHAQYNREIYNEYKDLVTDTRAVIFKHANE